MSAPFGPFYPMPLQGVVSHAERLVEALRAIERELAGSRWADPTDPTDAERWLQGRAEEIETFVLDVVHEWRSHMVSLEIATEVLASYVMDMHTGYTAMFGRLSPGCCSVEEKRTIAQSEIRTVVPSRTKSAWTRLMTFSFGKPMTPTPSTPRVV